MNKLPDINGTYNTESKKIPLLKKILPSPFFYIRCARLVWKASILCKQSLYGNTEWSDSSLTILQTMENVGGMIEVTGIDIIKEIKRPVVFIGNHMSSLETMILPCIIEPYVDCTFVIKQGIYDMPVFKHLIRARNPIVVQRKNPRADFALVMSKGVEILNSGRSIIIFPQTTRTVKFDPDEFNTIGIKLAKRANVDVIPIALKTDAWGNGKILKEVGKIDPSKRIHITFGNPINPDNPRLAHSSVISFITSKLQLWGAL
ncbi:MAG: 1-acyl-sn-glycerol-3-phosphate acyltransferase [Nitrospirae bacterium]|nr:1-acyl-sn-glycerol-3-phosphate acyltransferase [Nitrospirota bacterium]